MTTLIIEHCSKTYPRILSRNRVCALDDVSLEVQRGTITALLGPNGAGKTTLIKCICGLIEPTAGQIYVNGERVTFVGRRFLTNVGALLEGSRNIYWNLSPLENLTYFANLRGLRTRNVIRRIHTLLEELGLHDKINEPVGKLSRGMQQKVALAVALLPNPSLLLLDEPTLGLDPISAEAVKAVMCRVRDDQQSAVLLTTHNLRVAEEVSDQIAILDRGRLRERASLSELKRQYGTGSHQFVIAGVLEDWQYHRLAVLGDIRPLTAAVSGRPRACLSTTDSINNVVSLVRTFGADVLSVTEEEPELEEIFMALVGHRSRPKGEELRGRVSIKPGGAE